MRLVPHLLISILLVLTSCSNYSKISYRKVRGSTLSINDVPLTTIAEVNLGLPSSLEVECSQQTNTRQIDGLDVIQSGLVEFKDTPSLNSSSKATVEAETRRGKYLEDEPNLKNDNSKSFEELISINKVRSDINELSSSSDYKQKSLRNWHRIVAITIVTIALFALTVFLVGLILSVTGVSQVIMLFIDQIPGYILFLISLVFIGIMIYLGSN